MHTLIGLDHTLPFVVLGRSQGWSLRKTLALTALCGLGHVLSSIVLGLLGIWLGIGLAGLEGIEASRGNLEAYTRVTGPIWTSCSSFPVKPDVRRFTTRL